MDGSFHITNLKDRDTLVATYIGYHFRKIIIDPASTKEIYLELEPFSESLKDVVVSTGYQVLSKERATGSFTQISEKELNTSAGTDILSQLKGITNGLSFDTRQPDNPQINIRGLGTIYGNAQPLIILDNFPFDGNINSINPNDVASVTILKDAAAASIWGVRAANGVIVINTKKGTLNSSRQISFNSNVTIGHKPDVFSLPMMSAKDFISVEQYLFGNGFYTAAESDPEHPPLTPAVELMIAQRDGKITAEQLSQQLDALGNLDVRNDFNRYLYQNSLNQQYALSMAGGGEKTAYYYSFGYDHNVDNLNAKYSRLNFRTDQSFTFGKVKLNPVVAYSRSLNTAGRSDYSLIRPGNDYALYPYAQLADVNGKPLPIVRDYRTSFVDSAQAKGLLNWQYMPLTDDEGHQQITVINNLTAGLNADYNVTHQLTAQVQYQYQYQSNTTVNLNTPDTYYTRNLINSFTQDDGAGNLSYPIPIGGILNNSNTSLIGNTGRAQLKYNNEWGRHELAVLIGAEIKEIRTQGYGNTSYGYNPSGLTTVPVNYTTYFPQYYNSGDQAGIPYNVNISDQTNRYTSYYANVSYSYNQRYMASVSARKDASNLFGVNSNQRGVPLWSTGLSWNVHQESFYPAGWLNYLKLRVTYGYNGNLPNNLTAVASLLTSSGNLNNQPYDIVSTYPNPNLQWEKVGVLNVGFDFGSRDRVITGSIEYYHKSGSDLIGKQPIDQTVGITSGLIQRNVADMVANGIDFQINSNNLKGIFKWQSGFILNYNRDRITSYTATTSSADAYVTSGYSVSPVVGQPVYNIATYQWGGLDPKTGDPIGYLNGQPSENYAAIIANTTLDQLNFKPALPDISGSLTNTFSFRGFSLYMNVGYRLGYYFLRQSISYYNLYNYWVGNSDFANRWQKAGDESHTNVPSMPSINNNNYQRDKLYTYSSELVEKADNIRLQEVNLSYQPVIPALSRLHVRELQIYLYGQNLGILWRANKYGIDPDYGSGYLPPSYTISFGCRAKF